MKNFEEELNRLEELTEKIQKGNIPLDDAVKIFEEGIKLSKKLEKELSRIEQKIEILINNPVKENDQPELGLFQAEK